MTACSNPVSASCACLPVCYRLCSVCSGEMCAACGFMGIVRTSPSESGNNIFVHQHPSESDPALAGTLMQCRENLMEDRARE